MNSDKKRTKNTDRTESVHVPLTEKNSQQKNEGMDTEGRADGLRAGCVQINRRSYLKVINRKLQHVSEDIT